jgi:hypothetical protein
MRWLAPRVLVADRDLDAPPGDPDGFAVAAEASRRYPALVVVCASAQPGAPDGRALTTHEHALLKQFMPETLVALVRQVIG